MFYFLRFSPGFSFNQNGLPPPPPPYTTIHLNFLNILTDKLHLFEVPALIPSEVHQNSHLVSAVLQSPGPGMMMVTTWHLSLPPNDHPPPGIGGRCEANPPSTGHFSLPLIFGTNLFSLQ